MPDAVAFTTGLGCTPQRHRDPLLIDPRFPSQPDTKEVFKTPKKKEKGAKIGSRALVHHLGRLWCATLDGFVSEMLLRGCRLDDAFFEGLWCATLDDFGFEMLRFGRRLAIDELLSNYKSWSRLVDLWAESGPKASVGPKGARRGKSSGNTFAADEWFDRLPERVQECVQEASFGRFMDTLPWVQGRTLSSSILALVEWWMDITHTFHLPFGEMMITSVDFVTITELLFGG
ncbi:hypothetical protein JCGZ_03136 [Jatropha curcas]|uniref:Aminotransferase-like plant mobile domain-containing protein n=1 Tax=Jatropha curcas TaxID=180498 RepID=A0A067JDN2_JATCU|nr:hypothetical protein JCGZ_03136 [Jatropha curcas]